MNVLSLFDGISACRLALQRAGHEVNTYYVSEIDKFAEKVSVGHYPDTVRLGDVTNWQSWDINWTSIDLVTGGFPCQSWSVAGNQLGDRDSRGLLFWVMLDIMKKVLCHNPRAYFLMENVKMKKEFEQYITHHTEQALGRVEKHLINSALVSAQNRQRYYWTNIQGITQPKDLGVLLSDIVERGDSNNGNFDALVNETLAKGGKSYCLPARYAGAVAWNSITRKQRTMIPYAKSNKKNPNTYNGVAYRKLTPVECERLQTFPDNWTASVSNTQRYKQLGNAWTVDIIAHIFSHIHEQKNG